MRSYLKTIVTTILTLFVFGLVFIGGMKEHPETLVIVRLVTAILQSLLIISLLTFVTNGVKNLLDQD